MKTRPFLFPAMAILFCLVVLAAPPVPVAAATGSPEKTSDGTMVVHTADLETCIETALENNRRGQGRHLP